MDEDRRAALAEQVAENLVTVIRGIMDDPRMGLSESQKEAFPAIVAEHLREVGD
jgi:excinuclease UvrABC ATPase subunit